MLVPVIRTPGATSFFSTLLNKIHLKTIGHWFVSYPYTQPQILKPTQIAKSVIDTYLLICTAVYPCWNRSFTATILPFREVHWAGWLFSVQMSQMQLQPSPPKPVAALSAIENRPLSTFFLPFKIFSNSETEKRLIVAAVSLYIYLTISMYKLT